MDILILGDSVTSLCKALKQVHFAPIILFSTETNREKALSVCEADDFIGKPFNLKELTELVDFYLEKAS